MVIADSLRACAFLVRRPTSTLLVQRHLIRCVNLDCLDFLPCYWESASKGAREQRRAGGGAVTMALTRRMGTKGRRSNVGCGDRRLDNNVLHEFAMFVRSVKKRFCFPQWPCIYSSSAYSAAAAAPACPTHQNAGLDKVYCCYNLLRCCAAIGVRFLWRTRSARCINTLTRQQQRHFAYSA